MRTGGRACAELQALTCRPLWRKRGGLGIRDEMGSMGLVCTRYKERTGVFEVHQCMFGRLPVPPAPRDVPQAQLTDNVPQFGTILVLYNGPYISNLERFH